MLCLHLDFFMLKRFPWLQLATVRKHLFSPLGVINTQLWGRDRLGKPLVCLDGGPEKGLSIWGQGSRKAPKLTYLLSLVHN